MTINNGALQFCDTKLIIEDILAWFMIANKITSKLIPITFKVYLIHFKQLENFVVQNLY